MLPAALIRKVRSLLGTRGFLDQAADLALYEYDGGVDKHAPDLVAFPRSTSEVAALVKLAREFGVPFVGRGAGTGLSGGAIPREGGLMIAFARDEPAARAALSMRQPRFGRKRAGGAVRVRGPRRWNTMRRRATAARSSGER